MITCDTNILVSAIWFGGKPAEFLRLALKEDVRVAISQPILDETLRVLREKFQAAPERLRKAEALIRSCTVMVRLKVRLNVITEDEPDNRALVFAVESESDTIFTATMTYCAGVGMYDRRGHRCRCYAVP